MKRLTLVGWDCVRGVVLGVLLCYALAQLIGLDRGALLFRYAGY